MLIQLPYSIKTKGMQVAPAELEGILLGHPDVADVSPHLLSVILQPIHGHCFSVLCRRRQRCIRVGTESAIIAPTIAHLMLYSGELPKGYVVLSASAANRVKGDAKALNAIEESVKDHVKKRTVNYKWLHAVEIIDEIPKSRRTVYLLVPALANGCVRPVWQAPAAYLARPCQSKGQAVKTSTLGECHRSSALDFV